MSLLLFPGDIEWYNIDEMRTARRKHRAGESLAVRRKKVMHTVRSHYQAYRIRRRRQTIVVLAALAVLALLIICIALLVRLFWPAPVDENKGLIQRVLERHFPIQASSNWLYGDFLDYPMQPEALSGRLIPILAIKEDLALKAKLEALFAAYPSRFEPSLYYYSPQDGSFVQFNAYRPVSAASVIKLPILLAYFHDVDQNVLRLNTPVVYLELHRAGGAGGLQYGPTGQVFSAREIVRQMIQLSDNTATNIMISYLGGSGVLNDEFKAMGMQDTRIRNWLPDLNGTNTISMYEMATILNNIQTGTFLSRTSREHALEILKGTHNRRLLPARLPSEAEIAHKTGDIGTALANSGIIYPPGKGYYIVSMHVERPFNDYTARDIIQEASKIIYDHYNGRGYQSTQPKWEKIP